MPAEYLPEVAWETIVKDVQVADATHYYVSVYPENPNDPGADLMAVTVGSYLKDWIGHTFKVVEVNIGGIPLRLRVEDSFSVGTGPQQGLTGIVYKSPTGSPFLAPIRHFRLDESALDYSRAIELDVLWKNLLHLDQTTPQTVYGGQPTFDEGFKLGLTPVSSNTAGEMYHDEVWKCMSYNNGDGTISQMSQEEHIYVYNNSASNILEGQAVYDTGSGGNGVGPTTTTVALAKADRISTSNVIGVATNNIPIGSYGKVTLRGKINKINTTTFGVAGNLLYLSTTVAGGLTTVKPDAPNLVIRVGKLDVNDAVNGSIEVSAVSWRDVMEISELKATQFPGISTETPIGLQDISINYTTRVVTITPPLGYFHYFTDGNGIIKKHEVVGSISFTPFTDTTGVWYFYFDNNGIVAPTQVPWSDFALIAPILRIVWDSTKTPDSAKALTVFAEYHQNNTSAIDHTWKHTYGSIWLNGLDVFSNVSTGNPNADGRNTVIGLNSGSMMDDNLPFSVTNTSTPSTYWQQDLGSNTAATLNSTNSGIFKIRYKGTSDAGVVEAGTRYPFLWDTLTNRPQYVNTLGVKTLVDHSYFFVYFCYGIPDGRTGNTIRLTPAYNQYATSTEADAVTWETVQTQDLASKDNEIRPLYKLVFEYKNGFDAGCKRTALRKIVDIRKGVVTQSVSSAGSILASSVIYTPFTGISSTNVQSLGLELYNKFQGTLNTLPKYNTTGIVNSKLTDDGTTLKYNNNLVWTAANDGVGSGLDADTLQGLSPSAFATPAMITTSINNLINSAPGTLDTLNELAIALGNDPNFATTTANALANKLSLDGGSMNNTNRVTNLNADLLHGHSMVDSGNNWGGITYIGSDGVMEVGKYLDFHNTDTATSDFDNRLESGAAGDLYLNGKKIWHEGNANLPTVDWSAKNINANGLIKAYRYPSATNLPAITLDKPGSYAYGIGPDGTNMRVRYGTAGLDGSVWYLKGDTGIEHYFDGKFTLNGTATLGTLAGYLKGTSGVVGAVSTIPQADITNLVSDLSNKQASDATLTSLAAVAGVQGDLLYASGVDTWTRLGKSTTAKSFLQNSGTSNNPAWSTITELDVAPMAYATLTVTSNATTWDCSTGLNKRVTISANLTLTITNLVDGMSGDLVINVSSISTISITTAGFTQKKYGSLTSKPVGKYHLCWICEGTNIDFNITDTPYA